MRQIYQYAIAGSNVLFFLLSGSVLAQPSFDCAKASTTDEKVICGDEILSELDLLVADAYRDYQPSYQSKKTVARALLTERSACGDDKTCIAAVLSSSLSTFGAHFPSWPADYALALVGRKAAHLAETNAEESSSIPSVPGHCLFTRIQDVTTRFGEPATYENTDAGTNVHFANGLYVVAYDRPWQLSEVKAGQRAVVCLMDIPHDCPTGDDRGRMFYTFDPETGTQWVMPDSQHMCGGA